MKHFLALELSSEEVCTWLQDLAARAIPAYIFFHLPFSLYFGVFLLVLGFLLLSIVSRFC